MRFKNDPVTDGILCVTGNLIFFSMVCDPGSQNEVIGTGEVILIHHHHLFIHLILRTKKKKDFPKAPSSNGRKSTLSFHVVRNHVFIWQCKKWWNCMPLIVVFQIPCFTSSLKILTILEFPVPFLLFTLLPCLMILGLHLS